GLGCEPGVDDSLADGLRDRRRDERAGEVRRGRDDDRRAWRERACADPGRDVVRGVVEAVREVEAERDDDHDDQEDVVQWFLTRIASSTSAAFSQASTASSSCSWMSFQRMSEIASTPPRKSSA